MNNGIRKNFLEMLKSLLTGRTKSHLKVDGLMSVVVNFMLLYDVQVCIPHWIGLLLKSKALENMICLLNNLEFNSYKTSV